MENNKIIDTKELCLICEERAYEKDGKVFSYLEYYVLCYGIKVPFIIKDNNVIGKELIKRKLLGKEAN